MSDNELISIIDKGEQLLNIKFPDNIKMLIAKFSKGYPSVCHQICQNICANKNINETQSSVVQIEMSDLGYAIKDYVFNKSDTFSRMFEVITNDGTENTKSIAKEIIKLYFALGEDILPFGVIYFNLINIVEVEINDDFSKFESIDYTNQQKVKLNTLLSELSSEKRLNVLNHIYMTDKYEFNNPFFLFYCYTRLRSEFSPKFNIEQLMQEDDFLLNNNRTIQKLGMIMNNIEST